MVVLFMGTFGTRSSKEGHGQSIIAGNEGAFSSPLDVPVAPAIDSEPPIALDKFIEQSGISAVTVWRYRRAGFLRTLNICGRHYLTRAEIARFNKRAAAGEFAKEPTRPKSRRGICRLRT